MDGFLGVYLFAALFGLLGFALFWGLVIFLIAKLFGSQTGMTSAQKAGLIAGLMHGSSRGAGPYEPGPIESEVGHIASSHGIDLNG